MTGVIWHTLMKRKPNYKTPRFTHCSLHNQYFHQHLVLIASFLRACDLSITTLAITEEEVVGELAGLNSSKSSGPDGIPDTLLKCASYKIANSLTGVFRLSLQASKVLFIVTTY